MTDSKRRAEIEVKPGQVWADNDWRMEGRTIEVTGIDGEHVLAVVRTDRVSAVRITVGNPVRILRRRMRPTSTGFRLIEDSPRVEPTDEGGVSS